MFIVPTIHYTDWCFLYFFAMFFLFLSFHLFDLWSAHNKWGKQFFSGNIGQDMNVYVTVRGICVAVFNLCDTHGLPWCAGSLWNHHAGGMHSVVQGYYLFLKNITSYTELKKKRSKLHLNQIHKLENIKAQCYLRYRYNTFSFFNLHSFVTLQCMYSCS